MSTAKQGGPLSSSDMLQVDKESCRAAAGAAHILIAEAARIFVAFPRLISLGA